MNKMSELNQEKINSSDTINEDKPKILLNYNDFQKVNLLDYFKNDQLKNRKEKLFDSRKLIANENELAFLKDNSSIIKSKQKSIELEAILREKKELNLLKKNRSESSKNRVYEARNPKIENLLKDIKTKDSVFQLSEELKNEFDTFLNIDYSSEPFRHLAIYEKKEFKPNNSWIFLTQDNQDEQLSQTNSKSKLECSEKKSYKSTDSLKKEKQLKQNQNNQLAIINKKNENIEKIYKNNNNENNLQIALIDSDMDADKNENRSSIIKLNKMLEHIKRIELPKFQPELHQICQYGNDAQLLKFYPCEIENDLNEKKNDLGRYCIHECCVKGNINMLKGLLPHIDDVNKLDHNNQTAAHVSAKYGELECIKILFANGADLQLSDKFGMQISHIAAKQDNAEILEFLFDIGISLNTRCKQGKLPLHYAAEFGCLNSIKTLSKYYVDISVPDNEGNSAAHLAAKHDHLKCIQYLIRLGLPVDQVKNNQGRNVAHICCIYGSVHTLHWLFENFSDRTDVDDNLNTYAHCCSLTGQGECFNCCIQHDAIFVEKLNKNGETVYDLARKHGRLLQIEKSAKNQITCSDCVKAALKYKLEKENGKSIAENAIENSSEIYSLKPISKELNIKRTIRSGKQNESKQQHYHFSKMNLDNKRDFIAQYFGPEN